MSDMKALQTLSVIIWYTLLIFVKLPNRTRKWPKWESRHGEVSSRLGVLWVFIFGAHLLAWLAFIRKLGVERLLLSLVFFQVFHPSPCTTCFVLLLLMGLSRRLFDFSFSGSQLLGFVLLSVVFCLNFDPYFFFSFSLVRLPGVFSLYLFIYL